MAMARQTLRRRREQQGFTQESIALALRVATSTYQAWEYGVSTPQPWRRPKLAELLDVTLAELNEMLDGAIAPSGQVILPWSNTFVSLEQGAAEIRAFEPVVVHGLLQTRDYAAAVESVGPGPRDEGVVARKVETRLARQAVLAREPDPLVLHVVLDESVLYRVAGSRAVMAAQLEHLAEVANLPNVDLRILTLDSGVFSAAFGNFALLTSPDSDGPYMAVIEDRSGPQYLDRPHDVAAHAWLFHYLAGVALPPAETNTLISSVVKERYT